MTKAGPRFLRTVGRLISASALLLIVTSAPAGACAVTDPNCAVEKVKDTADQVKETADNTVGDVKDQADETVEDVNETVESVKDQADDTVEDVKETAGGAVGGIKDTVDDTLNPGGGGGNPETPNPPQEPGVDKPKVKDGQQDRPKAANARNSRGNERGPRDRRGEAGRRSGLDSLVPPIELPLGLNDATDPTTPASATDRGTDVSPGLGESAIEAVKDFAFPLILAFIVGGFLLAQHTVDRREPKLLFAPVDQDMLSFE